MRRLGTPYDRQFRRIVRLNYLKRKHTEHFLLRLQLAVSSMQNKSLETDASKDAEIYLAASLTVL